MADGAGADTAKKRRSGPRVPSDAVPRQVQDDGWDADGQETIPIDDPPERDSSVVGAIPDAAKTIRMKRPESEEGIDIAFDDEDSVDPHEDVTVEVSRAQTMELSAEDFEDVNAVPAENLDATIPSAPAPEAVASAAETVAPAAEAAAPAAKRPPPPAPGPSAPPPDRVAKSRRRKGPPWHEEVFDENYLKTLPFLTPQATRAEAQFVMESLNVEAGGQILDVGCGYGRHAMEFAARGYHVVGLDSSLPLLLRGADEAQRRGLTINFVHGDMRELSFDAQFDGAFCVFSTFGFFEDDENKQTLKNIAQAMKPGAKFVVEVLNRDYLVRDLPTRVWWEGDGCVVLEEVEFNYFASRVVSKRSIVFDDGRQLEQEISIRCYSLHELGKLLHSVGFRVTEISGGMATRGRFFGAQSRDIVMVAERRSK